MNKRENLKIFRSSIGKLLDEKGVSYSFIQNENFNFRELKIGLVSGFKGRSVTIGIAEKMIQKLANQLVENEISYYILDCDYTSDKTLLELFSLTNWGDFESCWIEHGEIIKKYNLKPELQTFLQFMDLKLTQINDYLSDEIIKSFNLDLTKTKLGITEDAFQNKYEAIVRAKSRYKGCFLYDLMTYKQNGHLYDFEDERLIIYSETAPSHLSSCFVRVKSQMEIKQYRVT